MRHQRAHYPATQSAREGIASYLTKSIIPYVTEGVDRHPQLIAAASLVMIGGGELAELPPLLDKLSRPPFDRLPVLLHIDLVDGLTSDEAGLRYVATFDRV